ncbi:hypothetical protein B0H14DRAFT_2558172 [Mycena olivaceomarginata]|nr:hypothetical protein B0H14DRAFT_2558172 [Mycena olivaceomarginata]
MKSSKNTQPPPKGRERRFAHLPLWQPDARLQLGIEKSTQALDEERDKARERMARHRDPVMDQAELAEDFRARAREASHCYRGKLEGSITYEARHGRHAWLKHQNELEERHAEAEAAEEITKFRRRAAEVERIHICCMTTIHGVHLPGARVIAESDAKFTVFRGLHSIFVTTMHGVHLPGAQFVTEPDAKILEGFFSEI